MGDGRYIIYDGDSIGDQLARAYLANDEKTLRRIDADLRQSMHEATRYLVSIGCGIVTSGADGITARIESIEPGALHRELARIVIPYTFSMGVGTTLREAFFCLRYAKAAGRNHWAQLSSSGHLCAESHGQRETPDE
jgi:hypothetical protein